MCQIELCFSIFLSTFVAILSIVGYKILANLLTVFFNGPSRLSAPNIQDFALQGKGKIIHLLKYFTVQSR